MRARTSAGAVAALAATAVAALAGCGGSGGGDSKISSSPTTPPTTASAQPSATAGGVPLRIDPTLSLPPDVKVVFDWRTPAGHAQSAALSGAANFLQAIDHAVTKQNANDPGLRAYSTANALAYARHYVQENVSAKQTLSGTDRYYQPQFVASGTGSVEIRLCNNQSKLYSKDVATGKVHVTQLSPQDYVLFDIVMVKFPSATELWQANAVTAKEGALQCKQ